MNRRLLAAVVMAAVSFSVVARALPASAHSPASVLVVGGTPAGVAAAVSAARAGTDVTLVAPGLQLGGILTDAMMDQWDLNLAPDGSAIQGGLFREIYAQLGDAFTPDDAARVFLGLVQSEPHIHLITEARAVDVRTSVENGRRAVDGVRFTRANGSTFEIDAREVVDATDDGDVAALAGARYDLGRQDTGMDERMQPVTLMFTIEDLDWSRVVTGYDPVRYGAGGATDKRTWGYATILRAYHPLSPDVVVRDLNLGRESDGDVTANAIDVLGIDGRSPADLARARAISEAEAPHLIAFLRAHLPGFENATLGRYASAVYVRETRHFAGVDRLTADAVWDGSIPDDTIGLSSYPLDLHPVTAGDRLAYAPIRHVYGIPFGALVPRDFVNLLLASPAISASHVAAGSARVIPTTIEEGDAAGAAAAFADRSGMTFPIMARSAPAIAAVREQLTRSGSILTYDAPARSIARR
jgi:hypothetical protein